MINFLKQKRKLKPNEANVGKAYTFTATKENKTSKTKQNIGTLMVKNETKQHKHTHTQKQNMFTKQKTGTEMF